jgi:hypothetical protein
MNKDLQTNIEMIYEMLAKEYETVSAIYEAIMDGKFIWRELMTAIGADDALPQILAPENFQKHKGQIVYSGLNTASAVERAEKIMHGEYRDRSKYSGSALGLGYYFTEDFNHASSYSSPRLDLYEKQILAAKLDPNNSIVYYKDFEDHVKQDGIKVQKDQKLIATKPFARKKKIIANTLLTQCTPRYSLLAMIHGYDGAKDDYGVICVYNRAALNMQNDPLVDEPIEQKTN